MTPNLFQALSGFVRKTFGITEFELRKLRHDFTELITRALQPALWLVILGEVFSRNGAIHTGALPYLYFIAPGILAQSVLFVAIFYGISPASPDRKVLITAILDRFAPTVPTGPEEGGPPLTQSDRPDRSS
jgi:hypothetical protein